MIRALQMTERSWRVYSSDNDIEWLSVWTRLGDEPYASYEVVR